MSGRLREVMAEVAQASPPVRVPPDLFDRARRRRRAQVAAGALMAVAVLAGMVSLGFVVVTGPPEPLPAAVPHDRHAPQTLARAPKWVADLRDAPLDRAQFAYVEPDDEGNFARLIMVSGDRYRSTNLRGSLSPDGRYLAYREDESTKLLDVSTGLVAMSSEGEPMAWSRTGDSIVMRRLVGTEQRIEMEVVSVPSGAIIWSFDVAPLCVGREVSLSPSNELVAVGCVQEFGTYLYRRDVGLVWQASARDLAGPQAWSPDGRTIAAWAERDGGSIYSELFMLDVVDGKPIATIPVPVPDATTVIAWHEDRPVLQSAEYVIRLSAEPVYVTRVQSGLGLSVASGIVDFGQSRPQGGIDAGPFLARYRGLLPHVYITLFLAITLAWVLIARRVSRRRRPPRLPRQ